MGKQRETNMSVKHNRVQDPQNTVKWPLIKKQRQKKSKEDFFSINDTESNGSTYTKRNIKLCPSQKNNLNWITNQNIKCKTI